MSFLLVLSTSPLLINRVFHSQVIVLQLSLYSSPSVFNSQLLCSDTISQTGFFSLGGGSGRGKEQEREERGELFKSEEIYNKGFEIWPQSSTYHHQQQQQNLNNFYSFGEGPSSRRNNNNNSSNNNNNEDVNDDVSVSFSDESNRFGFTVMRPGGGLGGVGGGGMNCQYCGNQTGLVIFTPT